MYRTQAKSKQDTCLIIIIIIIILIMIIITPISIRLIAIITTIIITTGSFHRTPPLGGHFLPVALCVRWASR